MSMPSDFDPDGTDDAQNRADRDARRKQQDWTARWSAGWAEFEQGWAAGWAGFKQGWDQGWRPEEPDRGQ